MLSAQGVCVSVCVCVLGSHSLSIGVAAGGTVTKHGFCKKGLLDPEVFGRSVCVVDEVGPSVCPTRLIGKSGS